MGCSPDGDTDIVAGVLLRYTRKENSFTLKQGHEANNNQRKLLCMQTMQMI